ncbi:MAG: hypothetical protein A4E66_00553 [Syntrophus sp. PtaB.Bin001]|nr:MAG: hypothetical protein A4E66_00553 [Syntrophus sp. PtaB.Bin001]
MIPGEEDLVEAAGTDGHVDVFRMDGDLENPEAVYRLPEVPRRFRGRLGADHCHGFEIFPAGQVLFLLCQFRGFGAEVGGIGDNPRQGDLCCPIEVELLRFIGGKGAFRRQELFVFCRFGNQPFQAVFQGDPVARHGMGDRSCLAGDEEDDPFEKLHAGRVAFPGPRRLEDVALHPVRKDVEIQFVGIFAGKDLRVLLPGAHGVELGPDGHPRQFRIDGGAERLGSGRSRQETLIEEKRELLSQKIVDRPRIADLHGLLGIGHIAEKGRDVFCPFDADLRFCRKAFPPQRL